MTSANKPVKGHYIEHKESKLRSNVNWPGVLEEDGMKQVLGVLPFPNPKHTCIMASSLPLVLHLNG